MSTPDEIRRDEWRAEILRTDWVKAAISEAVTQSLKLKDTEMKWEARIFYLKDRYIAWPDCETIVGPLRSIECYLRSNSERISHVEMRPAP